MKSRRLAYVLALLPALALLTQSCSDDPSTPGSTSGTAKNNEGAIGKTFTADIGPEGGTLNAENMTLYVPPGAVDKKTTFKISVKSPATYAKGGEILGPVYELEPAGFKFGDRGVILSMPATRRPPAGEDAVIATLDPATNAWVPLEGSVEVGAGAKAIVHGRTTHFSAFTTWHAISKFPDERCRPLLNGGALGINEPDTLNIAGASLISRQKNYDGSIEYGSYWKINQPQVAVSGKGMLDGNGRWGAWVLNEPTSGRPKPVPTGFPIASNRFTFNADMASLVAQQKVAISVDDYCPGNIDIGWECATPGCAGAVTPGGPTDGGADADAAPPAPVQCQMGGLNPLTNAPRALAADGLNPILFGATDQTAAGAVTVFNVSNPAAPAITDTLDLQTNSIREVAISGATGYVTDGTRVVLVGMQNPSNIVELGSYNLDTDATLKAALGNPVNGVRAYGIAISGQILVVGTSDSGFVTLNVSNPSSITRSGFLTTGNVGVTNVVMNGTRAFVASNESRLCIPGPCATPNLKGFQIFDIANPTAPTKVADVSVPGSLPRSIAVNGNTVYVFDGSNSTMYPVDITNPQAPNVGAAISTSQSAQRGVVVGNKLFVSTSTTDAHFRVYDVSTPMNPQFLTEETVNGTGGAYALAANGTNVFVGGIGHLKVLNALCP